MAIFISYSHSDSKFVDALARVLVMHRRNVWVDRWELNVGDSLVTKVQSALEDASALLVVLSEASVQSEWCKKEISAGLIRELEERRVLILPVLLDGCKIPLLLRDKLYADFRTSFDDGIGKLLEATAAVAGNPQERIEDGNYKVDFSLDWEVIEADGEESIIWTLTSVAHSIDFPFSVLTQLHLLGNREATRRSRAYNAADLHWIAERELLEALIAHLQRSSLSVRLEDHHVHTTRFVVDTNRGRSQYLAKVMVRWLGTDTGKDVVVHVDQEIERFATDLLSRHREPTAEEHSRFLAELT